MTEIERLREQLDRMEQDWSDDNKAHLKEIERLKAERDELRKAVTDANDRADDAEDRAEAAEKRLAELGYGIGKIEIEYHGSGGYGDDR